MDNLLNLIPFFIVIAIALVVVISEIVKMLDKKNLLKGYRVYIPLIVSLFIVFLLRLGRFFAPEQIWFWWAVVFSLSVFSYEALLNKIKKALGENKDAVP
ncbi:MAG: hypothetical protein FWC19_06485 [Treponema sp.]|nr:hypothetical protein [Treponema sp.]MCL2272431.1 hypothetical protein [Treponema sp.]